MVLTGQQPSLARQKVCRPVQGGGASHLIEHVIGAEHLAELVDFQGFLRDLTHLGKAVPGVVLGGELAAVVGNHAVSVLHNELGVELGGQLGQKQAVLHIVGVGAPVHLPIFHPGLFAPEEPLGPIGLHRGAFLNGARGLGGNPQAQAAPAGLLYKIVELFQALSGSTGKGGEPFLVQLQSAEAVPAFIGVYAVGHVPAVVQHQIQVPSDFWELLEPAAQVFLIHLCPGKLGAHPAQVVVVIGMFVFPSKVLRAPGTPIVGARAGSVGD